MSMEHTVFAVDSNQERRESVQRLTLFAPSRPSRRWFFLLFLFVYFSFFNCRWWHIIEAMAP
jgi:hypothetical protein